MQLKVHDATSLDHPLPPTPLGVTRRTHVSTRLRLRHLCHSTLSHVRTVRVHVAHGRCTYTEGESNSGEYPSRSSPGHECFRYRAAVY